MTYPYIHHPPLRPEHFHEARLFADRCELLQSIGCPRRGVIAEIGVGLGDFSRFMIDALDPVQFVAIDVFPMHNYPEHWGRSSIEIFGDATHEEFYRERFRDEGDRMVVRSGLSHDMLAEFSNQMFDLIYIDVGHDYENVARDIRLSADKIKPNGFVILNDYTMFDQFLNEPYGVVPAVNEAVNAGDWFVVGFALDKQMFCDVALCPSSRPQAPGPSYSSE